MKQINALFREVTWCSFHYLCVLHSLKQLILRKGMFFVSLLQLKVVKAKVKDCMSEDDIKSLKFTEKQLINKVLICFFRIVSSHPLNIVTTMGRLLDSAGCTFS